jgi:hypothetical protein
MLRAAFYEDIARWAADDPARWVAPCVPMLQLIPSKTDAERLLLLSPELAVVLTAIIFRVRREPPRSAGVQTDSSGWSAVRWTWTGI